MGGTILRRLLACVLLVSFMLPTQNSNALQSKSRLMFMTSSYGVMLGALAGVATLAFYNDPSPHTRNVALGASLGLYTGIMLGVYMIYIKPDPNAKEAPAEQQSEEGAFLSPQVPIGVVATAGLFMPSQSMSALSNVRASSMQLESGDILVMPYLGATPDQRSPALGVSVLF